LRENSAVVDSTHACPVKSILQQAVAKLPWCHNLRLLDKLSAPDRADPDALNAILWHALKPGIPEPASVRSARLVR